MPILPALLMIVIYSLVTGAAIARLEEEALHRAADAVVLNMRRMEDAQEAFFAEEARFAVDVAELAAAGIPLPNLAGTGYGYGQEADGTRTVIANLAGAQGGQARRLAIMVASRLGGQPFARANEDTLAPGATQAQRAAAEGAIEMDLGGLARLPWLPLSGALPMEGNLDLDGNSLESVEVLDARVGRIDTLSTSNFRYLTEDP